MNSFQLSVVKIEGIKELGKCCFYIYQGQNILRVLNLENLDIHPIPITKGTLRFVIEDSQSSVTIASVSFVSDMFKIFGFHWLPLYFFNEKRLIEVPEEVRLPRILFDVQASILSPVPEITEESETYETYEDVSEDASPDEINLFKAKKIGMIKKIKDLEQALVYEKIKFDEQLEQIMMQSKSILTNLNLSLANKEETINRQEIAHQVAMNEIERLKINLELANNEREVALKNEEICKRAYDEIQMRENSILAMLELKDQEIFGLQNKVCKTDVALSISRIEGISLFDNKMQHQSEINSQINDIIKKNEIIEKKLYEAETKITNYQLKHHEEINAAVKHYFSLKNLENFATLSKELAYNFGGKKATVFLKSDKIYCKSFGITKQLEIFLQSSCIQELETFKRKCNIGSASSHKRAYSSMDFEKIGNSIIHKTFDRTVATKPKKRNPSVEFPRTSRSQAFSLS